VLQPSGSSLSLLHSEDYTWTASEPGFGLMPPTGNSTDTNGVWMHFEFATPVALDPDTQYAFDIGTTDASVQFYVETAGTSSNGYAGGSAYSTASKGALDMGTVHAGDHTFVVELAGTAVAPDTPTGLVAVSADEQVSLSWNPSANAASYSVRSAFTEGGPYSEVGTPAAESFVDAALTNGITYFYVVAAVGSGGESAETDPVSAVPSPAVAPEEFYIADSVVDAGNILMTVSNSVAGHNYEMLAADALTTNTAWSNVVIQAGTGSNLLFGIPIDSLPTNRFFMLDVQRQ